APEEYSDAAKIPDAAVLALPMPDGSLQRFSIQASSIMEPALAARFPEITTYIGQGLDDRAATARLDRTPLGFHAQILSPNGRVFVDPYIANDSQIYVSYFTRDYVKPADDWQCFTVDAEVATKTSAPAAVNAAS